MPGWDVRSLACDRFVAGTVDKQGHWDYNSAMSVNAEIITTGTELLLGELADTNSSYIARRLRTIGVNLFYITSVGDNEQRMVNTLTQALQRSDVIITTGGLGPTVDDVTRAAVARATHRGLVLHEDLLHQIEARFARWGRQMTANNRRQAYLPEDARPMENPVGTAPCFIVEEPNSIVISLPGVPREMEFLMERSVLPYLRERFGLSEVIKARTLKTCAIGESTIDDMLSDLMTLENPTVGLAAHPAQTDVRITAKAESEEEVDRLIAQVEAKIRERLGDVIYGTEKQRLEEVVAELLAVTRTTVSLLETVTHGSVGRRLLGALGERDGRLLKGNQVLNGDLDGLREQLAATLGCATDEVKALEQDGEALAVRVARDIRARDGVDVGIAIVGLDALDEGSFDPFYGKIWCALDTVEAGVVKPFSFGGESDMVIPWVSSMTLDMLRRMLVGKGNQPEY